VGTDEVREAADLHGHHLPHPSARAPPGARTAPLAALLPPLAAHAALLPAPPPAAPRPPPAPAQGSRHHRRRAINGHREREEGETEGERRTARRRRVQRRAGRRVREMGATERPCLPNGGGSSGGAEEEDVREMGQRGCCWVHRLG
jgi:hypothetical protein